ncbi:MAG: hypothetical protein FWF91_01360 [Coriobacteriia bacterium]|nr:hypothetical protein [Coriobacteriia bacterium]
MRFESKKIENCFTDAENHEYRIEVTGEEFLLLLKEKTASVKVNRQLRRPAFMAELKDGTRLKGILEKPVIKVGYPQDSAAEQKALFESWLSSL